MPMVYIWMHEGKSADYRRHVSDGIQAAMTNVLKVPQDVYDHFFNQLPIGGMVFGPNYFGVQRSTDVLYVHFFFNTRSKEVRAAFFEAVADGVTGRAGLRREDLIMAITEVPAGNWCAYGRTIEPAKGFETRMTGMKQNGGGPD